MDSRSYDLAGSELSFTRKRVRKWPNPHLTYTRNVWMATIGFSSPIPDVNQALGAEVDHLSVKCIVDTSGYYLHTSCDSKHRRAETRSRGTNNAIHRCCDWLYMPCNAKNSRRLGSWDHRGVMYVESLLQPYGAPSYPPSTSSNGTEKHSQRPVESRAENLSHFTNSRWEV